MRRLRVLTAACVTAVLLAACGGGSNTPPVQQQFPLRSLPVGYPMKMPHAAHRMLSVKALQERRLRADATSVPLLTYHNGFIQRWPKVYLVFWGFHQPDADPYNEAAYMQNFANGIKGTSWLNSVTQYYDTYWGSQRVPCISDSCGNYGNIVEDTWYDDLDPMPANPVSSSAEEAEADTARQHFGTYNQDAIVTIVYPHNHWPDGFTASGGPDCAWHGDTWHFDGNYWDPEPYVSMPYQTDGNCGENDVNAGPSGTLDGVSIVFGHEIAETITDPVYFGDSGWYDLNSEENGDKCSWNGHEFDLSTSTGTFAVQQLFSDATDDCVSSM